ncbi:MAG: hypothetical protein SNJ11_04095 [Rikenellaceae bacterium]
MAKHNYEAQFYRTIPLQLIRGYNWVTGDFKAMRYSINGTKQNVWIPKKHLDERGTIKPNENIDYVFKTQLGNLCRAGVHQEISGIKPKTLGKNSLKNAPHDRNYGWGRKWRKR